MSAFSAIVAGEVGAVLGAGFAEDGKTYVLMIRMADGSTAVVSACPGNPLTVLQDAEGIGHEREATQDERMLADEIAEATIARAARC